MGDSDRGDLERRLRIRRRNLERLEQEAREVEEAEAPPAVLGRLQAQIRVEREEIRLIEGQLADAEHRPRGRESSGGESKMPTPSIIARIVLALAATGVLLVIVFLVAPRPQVTRTAIPPTNTISPTFTPPSALAGQGMAAITGTQGITTAQGITEAQPEQAPAATPTTTPTATQVPPTPTPQVVTGSVTADPLNVRSGPATSFDALAQLAVGDIVTVTARNQASDWLAITTPDGQTGWVAAQFVSTTADLQSLPVK